MNQDIHIKQLTKRYGSHSIFDGLNLSIHHSLINVIFGPNGAGKSTFLNVLAGLSSYNEGEITGVNLSEMSYVFQNYREVLLPWLTVRNNICFPLKVKGLKSQAIAACFQSLIADFPDFLPWDKYPYQLSGGQQQAAVFLRSLITNPRLLLADEPFSALDYENSLRMRLFLQQYYLKYKPTVIMVSHHLEEVIHLSHQILLFSRAPVSIQANVKNKLPFPRGVEDMKSDEFRQLKQQILYQFQEIISP